MSIKYYYEIDKLVSIIHGQPPVVLELEDDDDDDDGGDDDDDDNDVRKPELSIFKVLSGHQSYLVKYKVLNKLFARRCRVVNVETLLLLLSLLLLLLLLLLLYYRHYYYIIIIIVTLSLERNYYYYYVIVRTLLLLRSRYSIVIIITLLSEHNYYDYYCVKSAAEVKVLLLKPLGRRHLSVIDNFLIFNEEHKNYFC